MPRLAKPMSPFLVPLRFEAGYRRAIHGLIMSQVPLQVDDSGVDGWLGRLSAVSFDRAFQAEAQRIAMRLVRDLNIHNVFGWRGVTKEVTGGAKVLPYLHETRRGSIGRVMYEQILESTSYISIIPTKLSDDLVSQVKRARSAGEGENEVIELVGRSFYSQLVKKINLVAQTDPHRINSALTEARSADLTIQCFIWRTAGDTSVRPSHQKMDEVVVFWDDLPSPEALIGLPSILGYYAPGNCPNCRCNAVPVLSVETLFRVIYSRIKVYWMGSIIQMTRQQFLQIMR